MIATPAEESPELQLQETERHSLVQASITRLDLQEEALLNLLYAQELTFEQISEDWWIEEPLLHAMHGWILLKLRQDLHWRGINKLADIL